jgi:hypothetical protein
MNKINLAHEYSLLRRIFDFCSSFAKRSPSGARLPVRKSPLLHRDPTRVFVLLKVPQKARHAHTHAHRWPYNTGSRCALMMLMEG